MVDKNKSNSLNTPSSTCNCEDLAHMLASLQAAIDARDVVIAALQCEQSYLLIDDAQKHRYFLNKSFEIDLDDPILALQKDALYFRPSNGLLDSGNAKTYFEESRNTKAVSFQELINTQRRAHASYREQLHFADQRYDALCSHIEEERARFELDAAQCDDVVALLQKEREKLQLELDSERNQNKRLKMELRKAIDNLSNQKDLSQRQRMVAAQLIKEKRRLQKDLLAKCERIQQLESNLKPDSPLLLDTSASTNIDGITTSGVDLPFPVGGGGESLRCRKSLSPPSTCRESVNAPPPPSSPLVPFCSSTAKLDNDTSSAVLVLDRVNGYSPPFSTASSDSLASEATKAKSPPPVKSRPEPPVRRTSEVNSTSALASLTIDTSEMGVMRRKATAIIPTTTPIELEEREDEKHSASPSPPPPPPQMQLHYPYPGMQGNPHHPPVRSPMSAFDGIPSISAVPHFSSARVPLSSPVPTTTCSSSHPFPYAQPQRVTPGGLLFTSVCNSGFLKTTPILSQQTRSSTATSAPHGRLVKSTVTPAPRVVVAGRGAVATAGSANLYINGK